MGRRRKPSGRKALIRSQRERPAEPDPSSTDTPGFGQPRSDPGWGDATWRDASRPETSWFDPPRPDPPRPDPPPPADFWRGPPRQESSWYGAASSAADVVGYADAEETGALGGDIDASGDADTGHGHRHRRAAPGSTGADVKFALLLLSLAYVLTLAIWFVHRTATGVAAGQSTSRVVLTGALFGSVSALSDAFLKAPRGRLWAALAGLSAAAAGYVALRRVLGDADGTLLRDAAPALLAFGVASTLCLGILAVLSATGRSGPPGRSSA
jgi:hypothetical protein